MIEYAIDLEEKTVRVRVHGVLSKTEISDYLKRLSSDSKIPPGFREVVDLSECDSFTLKYDETDPVLSLFGNLNTTKDLTVSYVLASSDLNYGTARMLGTLLERNGIQVEVFRDKEKFEAAQGKP